MTCSGICSIAEGVQTVIEIGLAYGSSALAIGEALVAVGGPDARHLVIDPFQRVGVQQRRLGAVVLGGARCDHRPHRSKSSVALPQLYAEDFVADAAFVDGSHRFHEVFVDLYFLRKIVRPGGLVVIDDDWVPSVRAAARYYERNLSWREVPAAFADGTRRPVRGDPAAEAVPRCRALRLPETMLEPGFEDFQPF